MAPRTASKSVVDVNRLNGAEKCAVILLALGEEHAQVWKALEAGQGLDWIRDEVVSRWPIPPEEGMAMVSMVLQDLLQRGLIARTA